MIVAILGPPLLAAGWWAVLSAITPVERAEIDFGIGPPGQLEKAIELYEKYQRSNP